MSMNARQVRNEIIIPTLLELNTTLPVGNIQAATRLLLGTIAHESKGGHYIVQVGGPARGIYQMEPATLQDLYQNFLRTRGWEFQEAVRKNSVGKAIVDPYQLTWNMRYATVCARLQYYRAPEPLPHADDTEGLAEYWHKHWCRGCKGTVADWIRDFKIWAINSK